MQDLLSAAAFAPVRQRLLDAAARLGAHGQAVGARVLASRRWRRDAPAAITALMLGERCLAARVEVTPAGLRLAAVASGTAAELAQWKPLLRGSRGLLVLRSEERHLLVLDKPEVPDAELELAVRWPLGEALEIDPDQLLSTLLLLPRINEAPRPQVLAIAAQLDTVRAQIAQLARAGLKVRSVDIADSALRGMALLQPADPHGTVVVAMMGAGLAIGLLWHDEFCALRTLPLRQNGAADAEFEEHLALQIQRTADHYERQATQLSVRRVLASMPALPASARESLRGALPMALQIFELDGALAMDDETRARCAGDDELSALACVAVARLIDSGAAARAPAPGSAEAAAPARAALAAAAQHSTAAQAAHPSATASAADGSAPAPGRSLALAELAPFDDSAMHAAGGGVGVEGAELPVLRIELPDPVEAAK